MYSAMIRGVLRVDAACTATWLSLLPRRRWGWGGREVSVLVERGKVFQRRKRKGGNISQENEEADFFNLGQVYSRER